MWFLNDRCLFVILLFVLVSVFFIVVVVERLGIILFKVLVFFICIIVIVFKVFIIFIYINNLKYSFLGIEYGVKLF